MDGTDDDIYEQLGISDWPDVLDRDAAIDATVAFYAVLGATPRTSTC